MKKILLLFVLFLSAYVSMAQTSDVDKNAALQLVSAQRSALGFTADDLNNLVVSSSYIDKSAGGVRLVYLQPTYKGIPVYNQIQALAFKNGQLAANSGRYESIARLSKTLNPVPALSAESAIRAALADRGLTATQPSVLLNSKENGRKLEFSNMGVSRFNITAELMWIPSEDGKQVTLGWQVYIVPTTTSDYWLVRVDANNGKTLGVTNQTVYCDWNTSKADNAADFKTRDIPVYSAANNSFNMKKLFDFKAGDQLTAGEPNSPSIVNGATYLVIKYPTEAPSFGAASLHTDPWTLSPGNATTHKWHYDGTTNYTISRGNNVWAKEDRAGNNSNSGLPATSSTTPDPLTFNFPPDYTVAPTTPLFQQFAITNLFYWNNLMHDMSYLYGFDEAAANFQSDNLGRGGAGNDFVYADAQDGGGTNNANFATPADGSNGRMQMYLFTAPNPDRDGDLDNGVVTHEYGHGISHRLTGGPGSGAGCLSNAERGDEGWSDYFALMMTTNWATATVNDGFNIPRPMGTYVLNQPTNGPGIRIHPYCTNMAIDPWTYSGVASSGGEVHDIGEIWCSTIWDMTWNIIQVAGINPNLFNPAGGGGNTIAMKLVIMGEKLQKCSPGFLDSRDAILQADQLLYGGTYHCAIVNAFAGRGMGFDAIQGSSGSTSDQTQGFSAEESSLLVNESVASQVEGGNVTFTHTVKAYCSALTGYTLRDTLPTNVTFVSATNGGTYNAGNRVVSWPVSLAVGATGTYAVTVNINAGTYFAPVTFINEPVASASIPAGWATAAATGTSNWVASSAQSHSAPNSLFGVDNAAAITDFTVATTSNVTLTAPQSATLSFWHNFDCEASWDGGVVEISNNNGSTWTDLGAAMTLNGYPSTLSTAGTNPIRGRNAFTGTSGGWIQTKADLAAYNGQAVRFRFRMTSDDNTANVGWYVDDINVSAVARVDLRSSLFNASNTRVHYSDTICYILPSSGCVPQTINSQPSNVTICAGSSASFAVTATGTPAPTYQWQISTTGTGGPWTNLTNGAPYSGVTTPTLVVNPTAVGMNGYAYRCVVSGCAAPENSAAAVLTVVAASVGGTINPANTPVCGTTNSGTLTLSGQVGTIIRWESATNLAGPWTAIANTTNTYTFTNLTQTTYYRVVVQVNGCVAVTSSVATVTFNAAQPMIIVADPGTTLCQGDPALLTAINGPTLFTFTSAGGATINSSGTASPYPLPITVAGLPAGAVVQNVVLTNLNHTWTGDIDVAVTGPTFVAGGNTQACMLLSDLGNDANDDAVNTTITFQDGAPRVPNVNPIPSGTYSPTNDGAVTDAMPAPGPTTTAATPLLTQLNAATMNGTWNLWINDQVAGDGGNLASWTIIFAVPGGPISGGTFTWTPATGLNQTTGNPVAASPATTTTYTVNHNNGAGCIRQATITLTINARPSVTTPPANTTVCAGQPATFTVVGAGAGITYQWQESTNGGGTYTSLANAAPYSGVNTATLTISPTTVAMNGYRYRCIIGGTCPPSVNSAAAILTVNPLPNVTVTPTSGCGGVAGINGLALTASGANTYTWAPFGGLYTNATATVPYGGGNAATVYAAPTAMTMYTVTGTLTATGCSNTASALINYTPPAPTVTPSSVTMCLGDAPVRLVSASAVYNTVSFPSGTVNVAVPDNNAAGAVSTVTVSGIPANATISSMAVRLNMSHTYPGDMIFNLKSPVTGAPILNLYKYAGGAFTGPASGVPTWGWYNAQVSSAGTSAFNSVTASPFTYNTPPVWKADLLNANVAGVVIQNPTGYVSNAANWNAIYPVPATGANGVWTLAMADGGPGDVGTLASWTLEITYYVGVPTTAATWSPVGGLFTDPAGLNAYTGTPRDTVYARPTPEGVYPYQVTVQSLPPANAAPSTPMAGGNGNNMVFFNITNNNGYPMTLTGISTNTFGSGAVTARAFYKTSAIAGNPGLINAGNGWNQTGGSINSNVTAGALNPVLTGLSLSIPAGATYGIGLELSGATFPAYTNGTGTIATYTDNGVTITTDGNVGWGGPVAPGPPANNPRNFNGTVYLSPAGVSACTSPAKTVTVTVNKVASVPAGSQPVNQTVCTDKVATFSIGAVSGTGPFSYQWQVSTNNGNPPYTNISNGGVYSGATTNTLVITAPPVSMNGYTYRCLVQGAAPCPAATSNFAVLTVNPLPTVVISASPFTRLFPGLTTTLSSSVTPYAAATNGYKWYRDGVLVPGTSNSGSLLLDVDKLGDYMLTVTDVNGCVNSSNTVSITDSVNTTLFIYPNPNNGVFQVRYYSALRNVLPRGLVVYDAKGARIYNASYNINAPYARMDVDLRNFGKGVYWIELLDRNNQRLAVGRAVVQ
ncbi:MAG: M36 family metallopeptidase [Ferruginibacter sp.]